ncbi:hypothetical protein W02_04500 [Nitrospira sp. KM1]|uniref:putative signal transducing protein n=1 Tax=Nitrospira sp. KM1 TaxID=1936990 RepID=UPI0013A76A92|nr:DUF2007 domain-containing protein [Nitrospira sp. KM1]BCA53310.1 hypothetical protein W02_04500 [Nitrospira sp. KM1]
MNHVLLTNAYDVCELIMLQSLLEGSGIEYTVRHANVGSLYPGITALTPQVFVGAKDVERAERLLGRLRLAVRDVSEELPDSC